MKKASIDASSEDSLITIDSPALYELVTMVLQQAKSLGATAAEVGANVSGGFDINVRLGEVETVSFTRDKGLAISVYFGQRKGSASTADTSVEAIKLTVEKACHIARYTSEDPFSGLADASLMAYEYPALSLYYPWALTIDEGIALATDCEARALAKDPRITNSEGSQVSTVQSYRVYGNSHGFIGGYATSRHDLSCVLIANAGEEMQRDYSYTVARDPLDLQSAEWVASEAARRTVARLGSRRLKTSSIPVLFAPEVARGLLGHFLGAISGGNLYRKSSFLLDSLHQSVFSPTIQIREEPHIIKGLASAPFDDEGVRTESRDLVRDGILQGYILGSYSARKLGMQTTGNAGGAHNLFVQPGPDDFAGLLQRMDCGLLVTEVMGQGVNMVTGDYSRGAAGFWVEKGKIQYPVNEVTIAGNLRDMFMNIVAVGRDVDTRAGLQTGSVLLASMTVAGE